MIVENDIARMLMVITRKKLLILFFFVSGIFAKEELAKGVVLLKVIPVPVDQLGISSLVMALFIIGIADSPLARKSIPTVWSYDKGRTLSLITTIPITIQKTWLSPKSKVKMNSTGIRSSIIRSSSHKSCLYYHPSELI